MIQREEVERVAKMCHDASYDERLADGMLYRNAATLLRSLVAEGDKFKWQVRDTCLRAEKAEAERDALKEAVASQLRTINALMAGMPDEGTTPVIRRIAHIEEENAALKAENSKLRSALEIVHFKREPWQ